MENIQNEMYTFTLTLASKEVGKFYFAEESKSFELGDGLAMTLIPRDAETLDKAMQYHIEAGGFDSEDTARAFAEQLKVKLRVISAVLGLGLNIPSKDVVQGSVSDILKQKLMEEHDAVILDQIWGVSVYPDDGRHFEHVWKGRINVHPSDPCYIFDALAKIWPLKINLDYQSEVALNILTLAMQEVSEKASFLMCYLALEQLIERKERSEAVRKKIIDFQVMLTEIAKSDSGEISLSEAQSVNGALAALREESFSSALSRFARSLVSPSHIRGVAVKKFFSACIAVRNQIAHRSEISSDIPLSDLIGGLREFVINLIWSTNKLPDFSAQMPSSVLTIPEGGMTARVL